MEGAPEECWGGARTDPVLPFVGPLDMGKPEIEEWMDDGRM